ncbi:MAG: right-handed parallel beta-helix repeat-containing protein [Chloroflexota bacterium]
MKQKAMIFVWTALFLVVTAMPVAAQSFDVDNSDPDCDDTIGQPFCTIQAAVDAASPGDVVRVEGGGDDYEEFVRIDKENLRLEGSGQPAITSMSDNIVEIHADGVRIKDFEIYDGLIGVALFDVSDVEVEDNEIHSLDGVGVHIQGDNNLIEDNHIHRSVTNGIFVAPGSSNNRITDNRIEDNGLTRTGKEGTAVYVTDSDNNQIDDNDIVNNQAPDSAAVYLEFSDENRVESNTISGNVNGVFVDDALRNVVRRNKVRDNTGDYGIHANHLADTTLIERNDVERQGTAGVGIGISVAGIEAIVSKNTVEESESHGIFVDGPDNMIKQNKSRRNGGDGIHVIGGEENVIERNRTDENDGHGIHGKGDGNLYTRNRADENEGVGLQIESDDSEVSKNKARRNGSFGFVIGGNGSVIDDNEARDNGDDGFYSDGRLNEFTDNTSRGNDTDGFHMDNTDNRLEDNEATGNGDHGFKDTSTNNTYVDNECKHNVNGSDPGTCDGE